MSERDLRSLAETSCDSCGRSARLTYSPLHEAHFCFECLQREVPDPDAPVLG